MNRKFKSVYCVNVKTPCTSESATGVNYVEQTICVSTRIALFEIIDSLIDPSIGISVFEQIEEAGE